MQQQQENLWDYGAVEPGQAGTPTVVQLTEAHIARYAETAQCADPRYQPGGPRQGYSGGVVAMPTMVLTYAPLLRDNILPVFHGKEPHPRTGRSPRPPETTRRKHRSRRTPE